MPRGRVRQDGGARRMRQAAVGVRLVLRRGRAAGRQLGDGVYFGADGEAAGLPASSAAEERGQGAADRGGARQVGQIYGGGAGVGPGRPWAPRKVGLRV